MKILFISEKLPLPDHASGDLRFFSLLKILASAYEVHLAVFGYLAQQEKLGVERFDDYCCLLSKAGVQIHLGQLIYWLRRGQWDAIAFEFYHAARPQWIVEARYHNPKAILIIDSVDVHFKRWYEKANITGRREDYAFAEQTRKEELDAYRRADYVLAVTEPDRQLILSHLPTSKTAVVPNIHRIHAPELEHEQSPCRLVFVGSFLHDPNIDAVGYFCRDILPLIAAKIPVQVDIIGSSPPPKVYRLHGGPVNVLGYVAETLPYLKRSHISIAPLRYGAGMKGKIGEAMACGLPVVTTSVGAEGFGFTPGKHLLIGDTPQAFAEHVVSLYQDPTRYENVRLAGWHFIRQNYSEESLAPVLLQIFSDLLHTQPKSLAFREWFAKSLALEYERRLAWRFKA